jgi:hypothetical protein
LFSGSAGVDTDGAVVSLTLDGWRDGERGFAHLDVNRHQNTKRFEDVLAIVLADEIQAQMKAEIEDALIEWADQKNESYQPDFERFHDVHDTEGR